MPGLFVTRRGRGPPQGVVVLALTVEQVRRLGVAVGGVGVVLRPGPEPMIAEGMAVHCLGLADFPCHWRVEARWL